MRIERTCKSCKKKFVAQKEKQFYCSRKCFKKEYYKRKKIVDAEETFPSFTCPKCSTVTELAFNPMKDFLSWSRFKCPTCHPQVKHEFAIIMSSNQIFITF